MWILVTGSPIEGFTFIGPFEDGEDASDHAFERFKNSDYTDWWIAELQPEDA